jgi:hypothetical protein
VPSVVVDAAEVVLEAFDELLMAGGLGGPAASFRIVSEGLHVGKLILECGCELGAGTSCRSVRRWRRGRRRR